MIKAVIFDWNGVLTDSLKLDHKIFHEQAKRKGLKVPKSLKFYRTLWYANAFDELKKIGYEVDENTMVAYKKSYLANIDKAGVFPGIKIMINALKKNHKLGVITSNYLDCLNVFLKNNAMEKDFDMVLTADTHRRKEEKIRIFLEKFSLTKQDVIFVGDTVSDLDACRKAEIKFIAAVWGYQKEKDFAGHGADFIAKKPEEIIKIVERL